MTRIIIYQSLNLLNTSKINANIVTVDIAVERSTAIIGDYYGTKALNLSKYKNVISIVPISATCKTSPGSVGILGRYSYNGTDPVYALSAPVQGTYSCDFLILYTSSI